MSLETESTPAVTGSITHTATLTLMVLPVTGPAAGHLAGQTIRLRAMGWLRRFRRQGGASPVADVIRDKLRNDMGPPRGGPYGGLAVRLAELVTAEVPRYETLTGAQRERKRDRRFLDELVRTGEPAESWLRDMVEIRAIGHLLNEWGGKPLMRTVAGQAARVSRAPSALRYIETWWDGIGGWQG